MHRTYEIAGCRMQFNAPFAWEDSKQFFPFLRENGENTDLRITFVPVKQPLFAEETPLDGNGYRAFTQDGISYLGRHFHRERCHAWTVYDGENVTAYYLSGMERYFSTPHQLFAAVSPEQLLSFRTGFILHSSFVHWNGEGILFTAPSGMGKSTQAALWERYEKADVWNGDRTALRLFKGVWHGCGLPYAGSSDIYIDAHCPVRAVAVLRQSEENRVHSMNCAEAFRCLYRETTIHSTDREFVERIFGILSAFVQDVPVLLLECRSERQAVELLKAELFRIREG